MSIFSNYKKSVCQNFNEDRKTYSSKSLFDITLMECYTTISKIPDGFPKLWTNKLLLPRDIQRQICYNFNTIWGVYFESFNIDICMCVEHIDLNSGIILPCCQKFLTSIINIHVGTGNIYKKKFNVVLNDQVYFICQKCYTYFETNLPNLINRPKFIVHYPRNILDSAIIRSFNDGYCDLCKVGSFFYSDLSFIDRTCNNTLCLEHYPK